MKLFQNILLLGAMLLSFTAKADDNGRLFIIGSATPYGWELDMAQSLLSTPDNPGVYTGTIYLKGGEENTFKFMEAHEWGNTEYGIPAASAVQGNIQLASGTLDNEYSQMYVTENGNYNISIDTNNLVGVIKPSDYQENEIKYCSLFLIGDATDGGWTVENGTPLYQTKTAPYEYSAIVTLKSQGSFKIANALRGAGSWNPQYYYFKDVDDDTKISTDSTDDRQWSVSNDGDYRVTVNVISHTISILSATGIEENTNSAVETNIPSVYYNLQGNKINQPSTGIYIEIRGNKATKIIRH